MENLFFNDPFSTWIQHWKSQLPRSKTAKRRLSRIVRSNLSFLLCRSAPKYFTRIVSDVPYTNTDPETSKTKRTKFSDRFCKSGRSVACVMKVFHVVVSLNHLSRREVVQSNLDYPDSSGPQKKVRIIESPDNRKYEY